MAGQYAFVTLVSSDAYLPGALAQAAALRDLHPSPPVFPEVPFQLVCLVTPETVDITTIKLLRRAFDLVVGVEVLEQDNNQNLQLLGRPDLTTVLTKLHVFRLTQYSKIVFLDADVLPIRQLSHLFNTPHEFAAAPDVGWPDIFNSGVLVLSPGEDNFNDLNDLLHSKGSWDGGDQGLLNEWRAGDWHRLSFTYNTTPTAAYTYAPAYERYGSQINAIHFIGPNKPWSSIPFRSPFLAEKTAASSSTTEPQSPQQVYDYESLVDRWYAVYDKHYRSVPIPTPQFEVKRYPSAWDNSTSSAPSQGTPDKTFSLEDLRKLAIEGMAGVGFGTNSSGGQAGEGEYRTLPLEGRFDLMRPRKPPAESEDDLLSTPEATLSPEPKLENDYFDSERDLPMTPIVRHHALSDDIAGWQALPTPGANELPPSPKIPLKSLPATPTPAPDYYASSAGPTSDSEGWGSASGSTNRTIPFPSHLFTQTPPPHRPPSQITTHGETANQQHQQAHHHHPHHSQHEHQHRSHHRHSNHATEDVTHIHDQPHPSQNSRPPSPPLVSWNPAIEPPPNEPPPLSSFPSDTYFTNVWDEKHRQEPPAPQKASVGRPSLFFHVPPPPQIPETLREQGHYWNVTGGGTPGSAVSPDPTKVRPVFPWENKPRTMPGRVFPESDAPSPTRFVMPKKQTLPPTPTSKPRDKNKVPKRIQPGPIPGPSSSLSYSNAWDIVPGIQNYASLLVRPPVPPPEENRWQSGGRDRSWDEKTEASSRDGDDEDEGDEDEDEDARGVDSDNDRKSRSSLVEDTRQVQKLAQKTYRSRGVQTIPRENRNQSVQVSVLVEAPPSQAGSRRSSWSSKRSASVGTGGSSSPAHGRDVIRTPDPLGKPGHPPTPSFPRSRSMSNGSFGQSVPMEISSRPHREFITSPLSQPPRPSAKTISTPRVPETPRVPSPARVPTPKSVPTPKFTPQSKLPSSPSRPSIQTNSHIKAPSIANRQISIDSSIGSPPSSVGPMSPPDDQPFTNSPIRKGTRVWDPARGVEVFKRGSEEVLARFLKMGSWDENTR